MTDVNFMNIDYKEIVVMIDENDYEFNCGEYELMQYTGLTDKNGREIYEGDVVESFTIPNGYICRGVVVFENGSFLMDVKNAPFAESGFKGDFDERIREYTVLGNIYENPEMLEDETNE